MISLIVLGTEHIAQWGFGAWFVKQQQKLATQDNLTYWKRSAVRVPILDSVLKKMRGVSSKREQFLQQKITSTVRSVVNTQAFEHAVGCAVTKNSWVRRKIAEKSKPAVRRDRVRVV